jgi:hypothetical protein
MEIQLGLLGATIAYDGLNKYLKHRQKIIDDGKQDELISSRIKKYSNDIYIRMSNSRNSTPIKKEDEIPLLKDIIELSTDCIKKKPIDNIIDAYAFNFFDAAKTDRYLDNHPELSRPTWVDPISHYYSSEVGRRLIADGKRAIGILRKHLDIDRKNDLKAFTAMVLTGGPARGNGGGGPVGGSGGPVSGPVSAKANKPPTKLVKSCPVCTFDNDAAAMVCSQCGTSLADVVPGPPQAGGKRRKTTRFTTKRRSNKGKTQKRLKRF